MRMLKYSPEYALPRYLLWFQSLYPTPVSELLIHYLQIHPGSGLLLLLDVDRSTKIVTKLKLTDKLFKNMAFFKDMLSGMSAVAKFDGANV